MGTRFEFVIYAPDEAAADRAAEAGWARVNQLNDILSDYDPNSELSRLSATTDNGPMTQPVRVSDDLWNVLEHGVRAARLSDGAFDISIGPLSQLQRQMRKNHAAPATQQLAEARAAAGWRYIKLDPATHSVQLLHAKMRLDVGGIAKGYTSDQVLIEFRKVGVTHALCGAAGDIAAGDPPPGRDGWRVAIQSLKEPDRIADYVDLHDYAVSTSGDTYRSAEVDGIRYSHIVDPQSGLGLTHRIGVTTLAPHGVTADWMATAISVLGPQRGIAMTEQVPGAAARMVTLDDAGHETVYESKQFARFLVKQNASSTLTTKPVH